VGTAVTGGEDWQAEGEQNPTPARGKPEGGGRGNHEAKHLSEKLIRETVERGGERGFLAQGRSF